MYLTDLSTDLQDALNKNVVGPFRTEIIIDPDGDAIDISDYLSDRGSLKISKQKSIRPFGSIGQFTISQVNLTLTDGTYFDPTNKASPFYRANTRLYEAKADGNPYIRITKGDAAKFTSVAKIRVANDKTYTVSSIDTTPTDYDQLNISGTTTGVYSGGQFVEVEPILGKKVIIKTIVGSETDKITQFVGVVGRYPRISEDKVELQLNDRFKTLLDIPLKANSIRKAINSVGALETTVEITRRRSGENASTGTFLATTDNSMVLDLTLCKIGSWEIEFLDNNGEYRMSDPDGLKLEGNIADEFFYFTTNGETQITIIDSSWAGSFDRGDKITFQTICTLAKDVSTYDHIPGHLYNLLNASYGAALPSSDIDDSFTSLIADYDDNRGAISFTRSTTVLKAIELLQSHINASVFQKNDGSFAVVAYRPTPDSSPPSATGDDSVISVQIENEVPIERIFGDYAFGDGGYQKNVKFPRLASSVGQPTTLKLPAYFSGDRAQAVGVCGRIYSLWRRGITNYKIELMWQYALALDLDDQLTLSSFYPLVTDQECEIIEIDKDLTNNSISINAIAVPFTDGNYCYTDQHNTDTGKVAW